MTFLSLYDSIDSTIHVAVIFDPENCRRYTQSLGLSTVNYNKINSNDDCTVICDRGYWYDTYLIIYKIKHNLSVVAYYNLTKYFPPAVITAAKDIIQTNVQLDQQIADKVNAIQSSEKERFIFTALGWKITQNKSVIN